MTKIKSHFKLIFSEVYGNKAKITREKTLDDIMWNHITDTEKLWEELEEIHMLNSLSDRPVEKQYIIKWIKKKRPEAYSNTINMVPLKHVEKYPGTTINYDYYIGYIN